MPSFVEPLAKLVNELSKLPGIGRRTAARLAYHIIETDGQDAKALAEAILAAREKIVLCSECGDFADSERCPICRDATRDASV